MTVTESETESDEQAGFDGFDDGHSSLMDASVAEAEARVNSDDSAADASDEDGEPPVDIKSVAYWWLTGVMVYTTGVLGCALNGQPELAMSLLELDFLGGRLAQPVAYSVTFWTGTMALVAYPASFTKAAINNGLRAMKDR